MRRARVQTVILLLLILTSIMMLAGALFGEIASGRSRSVAIAALLLIGVSVLGLVRLRSGEHRD